MLGMWDDEDEACIYIFIGKSLGKFMLSRPRRWDDNNKLDLNKVGCDF
jgi:hypothetical protein